ncbi:MAG: hypothetical protein B7C54_05745 [Acidimicrobiales bacterium mtb01]|nr:MAG: hypothetical protein B7C54_05745 [Acidimicrobiales bacterium mtb01]
MTRGQWPKATLSKDAPAEARHVLEMSKRLEAAIGERSMRSVAIAAGVSVATLSNLLTGRTWGDVVTVFRLEQALEVSLWCGVHAGQRGGTKASSSRSGRHGATSGRSDLTSQRRSAK